MLKNAETLLPTVREYAAFDSVVEPLADAPYEQLGTWIFDGDSALSVTSRSDSTPVGPEVEVNFFKRWQRPAIAILTPLRR